MAGEEGRVWKFERVTSGIKGQKHKKLIYKIFNEAIKDNKNEYY